ncbi:UBP-type zinc finger domain-containing protein [Oligoflexus tunisiensis]|uniref:UBP-type zinc finger domain-containing protein n=1 Tax=Oligoflexus tunisiensis TaxID=708132 RepID=UPI00114CCB6D
MALCKDFRTLSPVTPHTTEGCEECLKSGDDWMHLRLCLACGHVGCCDDSPNKHATQHYHQTKHPVIQSFEPGETWLWCYAHNQMADFNTAFGSSSRVLTDDPHQSFSSSL